MTPPSNDSTKDGVIILGRGGYSDAPKDQLDLMVQTVRESSPGSFVTGAMVDHGSPSLPKSLDACVDAGATRVLVVPVFVPDDRSLSRWLSHIVQRWLQAHPNRSIDVAMADAIGDQPAMHAAVAKVVESARADEEFEAITPRERPFGDPDWSLIPPFRYHVLTCHGPRCTTLGSSSVWDHLSNRLHENNLGDNDVLVAQTGCLYPCNLGPTMVVYPEGVWYCGLTNGAIDRIVDEHFINGVPIAEYARYPNSRPQKRPEGEI